MAVANLTGMISLLSNMKTPQGVNPVPVRLPAPPELEGPLTPNNFLTRAQSYALNAISGPESMVVVNRYIYTGLKDGWVVEIQPSGFVRRILRMSIRSCGKPDAKEDACGRPLGVRADQQGYLVVADAYNGIFRIHPRTGQFRQLVDGRNQLVNGKPLRFINDLAVSKNGTIYFTSSSTKWKPSQILNIMFEGETTGRVLVYNPRELLASRRVQELVTNLHYPNGLQLSPDESFLLIGEGGRSKIHRAWISPESPKYGTIDVFADNLPGNVDNIRLSPRGTYWVGLSRARHAKLPSVLDTYGHQPSVRRNLITLVSNNMVFDDPNFGIVVELSSDGKIVRSLQDPDGSKYTSISEVAEEKGLLFIASKSRNFIGIIDLNALPPPPPPPPPTDFSLKNITNINLKQLLTTVNDRLMKLEVYKVRSIVLLLVQHLYEAKLQAKKALEQVAKLRHDLEDIRRQIQSGGGDSSPLPTTPGTATNWPVDPIGTGSTSSGVTAITDFSSSIFGTTEAGVVVPPDMGGSSGLSGSVDGGVSGGGGVAGLPGGLPEGSDMTQGLPGGYGTTQGYPGGFNMYPTWTTPPSGYGMTTSMTQAWESTSTQGADTSTYAGTTDGGSTSTPPIPAGTTTPVSLGPP